VLDRPSGDDSFDYGRNVGELIVDADVLARTRFGTSQLAETLAGLQILRSTAVQPWHLDWQRRHLPAFRERLAGDPVAAALVRCAFGRTWTADFLTVPPPAPELGLDEELAYLESLDDARIRADLEFVSGELPPVLSTTGLARAAADLLRWTWHAAVGPEWPRRRRVLHADVLARTARLSTEGWSGVLDGLAPGVRWLDNGRLQVNAHPYPPRDIRGRDLMLIAAHARGSSLSWHLPDRYALVYPVMGIFAGTPVPLPEPLVRLLGRTRARTLIRLGTPAGTSTLAAELDLPIGSVGGHLRVLLDAGLLERRRSGREVLYRWSDAGSALVTASGAG
jgi:DNA-binding transcriptional ArsR family regulator